MSIGIYKIENLLNHKIYVGQSSHIEKRWQEHCRKSGSSVISNAIKKYGKENFSFQILEECSLKQLNERERFYIKLYDCIVPKGYNIVLEQEQKAQQFKNYSQETLQSIIQDLKQSSLSIKEISDKYDLDLSMIYYINRGDYHFVEEENYPLRPVQDHSKKFYFCIDCGAPITKGAKRCISCAAIAQQTCDRPTREELKKLIRTTPFTTIGSSYGVSDNAVRHWCKIYNLPSKKTDIKKYSDNDWAKI